MSMYGIEAHICGVPCAMVLRGSANGHYQAVFERERASLEEIEAINWAQPVIEGSCHLPVGYGFTAQDISYSSNTRSYTVSLKVAEQFLGDVAGFQAQVDELTADVASQVATIQEQEQTIQAQAETIQALEAAGTAAQVEEKLEAAYQEGVESNG
jgi:hypothetical protein